jgi:hypothetical protein
MTRYYFNVCDDEGTVADFEGTECRNLLAVKLEAEASARELLVHDIRAIRHLNNRRVEVVDERGQVVATVRLKDLIH